MARATIPAGSAFAADQDGCVRRRRSRQEPVHIFHRAAFANHVVLQIDFRRQAQIFLLQPQQPPRIFQRNGGDAGDAGHQFQVLFVKTGDGVGRIQIDAANHPLKNRQRHAQ
jgi:hypothetical protein